MNAFDIAASQPWLITEDALNTILAVVTRTNDVEALQARVGRPLMNARRASNRDGTAIIPITGPIFRYANLFTEISGATSTEILARDLRTALDDPLVHSILLDINSPGGQASGISELSDMVYAGRQDKPIVAYAGGQLASAAYWIGSAADEIVIDRTGMAGSIGAALQIIDTRARDLKSGVSMIEIVSTQSPDKRVDPSTDEGRAKFQKIVDDIAAVFVSAVARNRAVPESTVLADYGRGGMMLGAAAVEAGLADRLGSLESVLSEFQSARNPTRMFFMKNPKGPITVNSTAELHAALAAGHAPEEISIVALDVAAIKAAAKAEGVAEGAATAESKAAGDLAKAATDATTKERSRVAGLNAIAMPGFDKEITAAIESGATVEDTAVIIAKLGRERGTVGHLAQSASDPVTHAGAGAAGATSAKGKPWSNITSKLNARVKSRKAG